MKDIDMKIPTMQNRMSAISSKLNSYVYHSDYILNSNNPLYST